MATPNDFDFDLTGVVVAWGANFMYTLRDGQKAKGHACIPGVLKHWFGEAAHTTYDVRQIWPNPDNEEDEGARSLSRDAKKGQGSLSLSPRARSSSGHLCIYSPESSPSSRDPGTLNPTP